MSPEEWEYYEALRTLESSLNQIKSTEIYSSSSYSRTMLKDMLERVVNLLPVTPDAEDIQSLAKRFKERLGDIETAMEIVRCNLRITGREQWQHLLNCLEHLRLTAALNISV